jgi:predicted acyltransferase
MQSAAKLAAPRAPSPRVLSVDVLRGLTIALMILVNDPGDWEHVYTQLDHAEWNGFTLTDFVFPNFLFLVGVSIVLSLSSRITKGESKRSLALHILRRAVIIFAIKLLLSAFPHFHLTHLRLFGVLTRIALCYLIAGLICLAIWNTRHRARTLAAITAALLIGYWALIRFVPVPGYGVPTHAIPILDPDLNLAAWLDRAFNAFTRAHLHTGSLYNRTRDPEGLLSTLPAIATTLIGSLTALWLSRVNDEGPHAGEEGGQAGDEGRHSDPELVEGEEPLYLHFSAPRITPTRCLSALLISGLASLAAGLLWSHTFPLNKNLWTSSYVLYSAGWSLLLLAFFYWLIDIRRLNSNPLGKALLWPWLVFGSNAITAYVLSNFLVELMLWIKVPSSAMRDPDTPTAPITAWLWTYRHLFAFHDSTNITSVAFALAFTAFCFLPNWLLWRKRIFLKI